MSFAEIIELIEYQPIELVKEKINDSTGIAIWQKYRNQINIEFPSFITNNKWRLTSQGWVGFIPIDLGTSIALRPKIPIINLFKMWEYAYRLRSFHFLDDIVECESIEGFYELIARLLANKIIERKKRGYYKAYKEENGDLSFVSGRIDINTMISRPLDSRIRCDYLDHTVDIEDNQILTWALYLITRSGICSTRTIPIVRAAFRSLQSITSLRIISSYLLKNRTYNRLNQDYQSMHALCKFFIDHTGPSYESGDNIMLPFLVDMARLYELFVYEWLNSRLKDEYNVKSQEYVQISNINNLKFTVDIVICDKVSDDVLYVLDTKYKNSEQPSTDDISQIISYAASTNCKNAILVYPIPLDNPYDWVTPNGIHVRSLSFDLGNDIEKSGERFIRQLIIR